MTKFIVRQTIIIKTTQLVEANDAKQAIEKAERLSIIGGPRITIETEYGPTQVGEVPGRVKSGRGTTEELVDQFFADCQQEGLPPNSEQLRSCCTIPFGCRGSYTTGHKI